MIAGTIGIEMPGMKGKEIMVAVAMTGGYVILNLPALLSRYIRVRICVLERIDAAWMHASHLNNSFSSC